MPPSVWEGESRNRDSLKRIYGSSTLFSIGFEKHFVGRGSMAKMHRLDLS